MAAVFGGIAFFASLACGALYYSFYFAVNEFDGVRGQYELNVYAYYMLVPAIAILLLFGISAFAAFTPIKQLSFVRCLMLISLSAMISVFIVISVSPAKSAPWLQPQCVSFIVFAMTITAAILVACGPETDNTHHKIAE